MHLFVICRSVCCYGVFFILFGVALMCLFRMCWCVVYLVCVRVFLCCCRLFVVVVCD